MRKATTSKFSAPKFRAAPLNQVATPAVLATPALGCGKSTSNGGKGHNGRCLPNDFICCCDTDHYTLEGSTQTQAIVTTPNPPGPPILTGGARFLWTVNASGVWELCGNIEYLYQSPAVTGADPFAALNPNNFAVVINESNVVLDGKGFNISSNGTSALGAILVAPGVQNVLIKNVRIHNFAAVGIYVDDGASNIRIEDVEIVDIGFDLLGNTNNNASQYVPTPFGGISAASRLRAGIAVSGRTFYNDLLVTQQNDPLPGRGGLIPAGQQLLPAGGLQFYTDVPCDAADNIRQFSYQEIQFVTREIHISNVIINGVAGPEPGLNTVAGEAVFPEFVASGIQVVGAQFVFAKDVTITDVSADDSSRGLNGVNIKNFNYNNVQTHRMVAGNGLAGVAANISAYGVVENCTATDNKLQFVLQANGTPIPLREQRGVAGLAFVDVAEVTLKNNVSSGQQIPIANFLLPGDTTESNIFRLKQVSGLLLRGSKNLLVNGHKDTATNNCGFGGDACDQLPTNVTRARPGAGVYHAPTGIRTFIDLNEITGFVSFSRFDPDVVPNTFAYDALAPYRLELHNVEVLDSDVGIFLDGASRFDLNASAVNLTLSQYAGTPLVSVPLEDLPEMFVSIIHTIIVQTRFPSNSYPVFGQYPGGPEGTVGLLVSGNNVRVVLKKSDLLVAEWLYSTNPVDRNLPVGFYTFLNLALPDSTPL